MSAHSYAIDVLPSNDHKVIAKCLVAAGYTNSRMGEDRDGTLHCTVDETVDWATMKAAVEENHPPPGGLSHNAADPLVIPGDGTTTAVVTITDPRGAAASGKPVKLAVPDGVFIPANADSFVLDANGQAAVTFGPLLGCYGSRLVEFSNPNGEVDPTTFTLRFGTV